MRSAAFLPAFAVLAAVLALPPASAGFGNDHEAKGPKNAGVFPLVDPTAAGVDARALHRLKQRAEETGSDAVVIVKDGRLIADWDFGEFTSMVSVLVPDDSARHD